MQTLSHCSWDKILPAGDLYVKLCGGRSRKWLDDLLPHIILHPSIIHMPNTAVRNSRGFCPKLHLVGVHYSYYSDKCSNDTMTPSCASAEMANLLHWQLRRSWVQMHYSIYWWIKQQKLVLMWALLSLLSASVFFFQWDVLRWQSHLHDWTWRTGQRRCKYSANLHLCCRGWWWLLSEGFINFLFFHLLTSSCFSVLLNFPWSDNQLRQLVWCNHTLLSDEL